jgi:hypothetical protein
MKQMSSETAFRRWFESEAKSLGYHVSHIESHQTSSGIPDLNLHRNGTDLWLELKVWRDGYHMLPSQRRWHRARAMAGGRSYVICYREDFMYVLPGEFAATLTPKAREWEKGDRYPRLDLIGLLVRL